MVDAPVYEAKLMEDVPEQFKNQDKIRVMFQAFAQQLDDLATFYRDLLTARTIYSAVGKQLDYIGDIVCLTRAEASAISALGGIMDDDLYRRYLLYKISLNTSSCTLQDIYDAVQGFAKDIALYHEDINHQATIILEMSDAMYQMFEHFKFAKAAGVLLDFKVFPTNNGDQFGLKTFFSYLPVERIHIDMSMVYDGILDLEQTLYYVEDEEREENPDFFPEAVAFYGDIPFNLSTANQSKNWDGGMQYFDPVYGWLDWNGGDVRSFWRNGWHVLALRGFQNTYVTGNSNIPFAIQNADSPYASRTVKVVGNIENLLDYISVREGRHPPMGDGAFASLFFPSVLGLTLDISRFSLPATQLSANCYYQMFINCGIIGTIELPAQIMYEGCYKRMFAGTRSEGGFRTPALPAVKLAPECYQEMFYHANLDRIPALPATILERDCYDGMFEETFYTTAEDLYAFEEEMDDEYKYPYKIPSNGEMPAEYAEEAPVVWNRNREPFKMEINKTYYTNKPVVR